MARSPLSLAQVWRAVKYEKKKKLEKKEEEILIDDDIESFSSIVRVEAKTRDGSANVELWRSGSIAARQWRPVPFEAAVRRLFPYVIKSLLPIRFFSGCDRSFDDFLSLLIFRSSHRHPANSVSIG